ncbi:MAG: DUF6089 family protein [Chitinophagaceae bacterium]
MRKILSFFAFLFITSISFSQRLHINSLVGSSFYAGDMQSYFFRFTQPGLALSAGISYQVSDRIFIRTGITYASVTADDKKNSRVFVRNLNFKSRIKELHVAAEYYLFNLDNIKISPYFFGGIALYRFNPYTKDTAGTKYFLQPLSTEGQGFYQGRQPYNLTQFAIPFGGGIKYALTDNIKIGVEVGMRKLFTDYLDDVSTSYADPNLLLSNRGPKALELAFRGAEINKSETYPVGFTKRGEEKNKDWYYLTGVILSFTIPAKGDNIDDGLNKSKNRKKYIQKCPR